MPRPMECNGMLWLALIQDPGFWNTATKLGEAQDIWRGHRGMFQPTASAKILANSQQLLENEQDYR